VAPCGRTKGSVLRIFVTGRRFGWCDAYLIDCAAAADLKNDTAWFKWVP